MRSTILFLTLLVFISCSTSQLESLDTVLLEMNKDPRSEAIFATMAMQLKQTGGFDRVLALLNSLVEDGRKQLHDATKLWSATEARCDVSSMKFAERQTFYQQRSTNLADAIVMVTDEKQYADNSQEFLSKSGDAISTALARILAGHAAEEKLMGDRITSAVAAVQNVQSAVDAVNNWSAAPTASAFVQAKLDKVSQSYLQVKSFQMIIPSSFVALAANDAQVKQRLLEWLSTLKLTFLEAQNDHTSQLNARKLRFRELEAALKDLADTYTADANMVKKDKVVFATSLNSLNTAIDFTKKLTSDNSQLVDANRAYCDTEKINFTKAKGIIEDQLKLFREVRTYFRNNYEKINKFVKNKYNA